MPALVEQVVELASKRPEVRDLAVDLGQMLARRRIHRTVRAVDVIGQRQQCPHPFEGEAEIPRARDERQTEMPRRVIPIVAISAQRFGE